MKRMGIAVCAAALVLGACSRGAPGPEPAIGPGEEPAIPAAPAYPEGGQARIEDREGTVEILRGFIAFPAEFGTLLAVGDTVRTGPDGGAEVRLGNLAGFRLLPGSEARLLVVRLSEGAAQVEVHLSYGAALFDVSRLSSGESFGVSTPRTLSAVRGTRFTVRAGETSTTAVREGRVAVLPAAAVLDSLAAAARTNALARQALRAVVALAPTAGPGQEIRVDDAALSRAHKAYADLESSLAALPAVLLESGFPDELWYASVLPDIPAPDAEAEVSLDRAWKAASSIRPHLALPVAAGPETLRGFERFGDFRSGPYTTPPVSVHPSVPPAHPSLLGRTGLSTRPLAGSLVRVPGLDMLVAADEAGRLFAFDSSGTVRWSLNTGNRGDARSYPVTYKGIAYYEGNDELVAVDGATGAVLARRPLEPGREPGTRPSPFPDSLLRSSASGIEVLDPLTLELRSTLPVAGGPGTLPAQRDAFALVVSKDGEFLLVDPVSGSVLARVPTGARGSSAVSPRILGEKACFADRTGLVVMVDLERMVVLWERRTGGPVLTDIEMAREGVLAYGNGTLFGYRLDGEPLMPPVPGVSSPPLLSRGSVYYGTEKGELVVAQVSPWRIRGTVTLGDVPSARPLQVGDTLYVGTRGGQLLRLDLAKLPQ